MTTKEIELKGVKLLTKLMVEDNIQGTDNDDKITATVDAFKELGVTLIPFLSCHDEKREWIRIEAITDDYVCKYPLEPSKRDVISIVLQRDINRNECELIKRDWRAFYNNPVKYRMSVVIDCIYSYLDDLLEVDVTVEE